MSLLSQSFNTTNLSGEALVNPTTLDFGPDGRLYVSQQNGIILAYTVQRDGAAPGSGSYSITATETINNINTGIPNHDDDGVFNSLSERLITGILVAGTSSNPILYVSSSDSRIGAGTSGNDVNLDTNSGILSRLTWTGSSWDRVDLVRGLPRCEENHATNGMDIFQNGGNTYLLLQQGGNTNKGAPSNNFAGTQETFLSAALLIVNLTQLEQMEAASGGPYLDTRNGTVQYIYDLPTLNDPERTDITNSHPSFPYPAGHPMFNATIDLGDPFGGNNGLNQAFPEAGGPVQIFSPGWRNAYDVVVTADGRIFSGDNGGNEDWGGTPLIYTSSNVLKGDEGSTTYNPGAGDYITNELNEGNSFTVGDALHYVGTVNDPNGTYYGGSPVPIRAFPSRAKVIKYVFNGSSWVAQSTNNWADLIAGTSGYFNSSFNIGNFPDDPDQGFFLAANTSDPRVNILDVVGSSTNGICEYTASNFGGAMQGDILTISWGGQINRYQLDGSGTGLLVKDNSFLTGFGGLPLDVIAQGDIDPFPGTIWAIGYTSNNIAVFEPADFGTCLQPTDPGYDPNDDYDSDGYTNADEVSNGTDHCNGGSQPNDNDNDLISDLNDPDDDNDGVNDLVDSFAIDPDNGTTTNLPIIYPFWNNDPGTGFVGVGFTGWMRNGTTDYLNQYDPLNLSFGGAGGKVTIDAVSEGDAFSGVNNQDNGFQFGINVDSNSAPFTVHSEIETPFGGVAPVDFQSYGIFIGNGDQDNYLKVVIMDGATNNDGIEGFEVLLEQNGSASGTLYDAPGLLGSTAVDIYISIDPSANTAQPMYSFDGGVTVIALGTPLTLPSSFLDPNDNQGMAVGIISTSIGAGPAFTATWDFINITTDGPSNLALVPDPIDFGILPVGSGVTPLDVTAQNTGGSGSGVINITDISFSGADAAMFSSATATPIPISGGSEQTLTLNFTPDSNPGLKSATMVITHSGDNSPLNIPVSANLSDFSIRINTGGGQTTYLSNVFEADQFFTGGATYHNTAAPLPFLYRTERNSFPKVINYDIPLNNGDYTVILHFAEIYWGATNGGPAGTGRRIFDVNLEGSLILDNYDINADVGPEVPVTKSFNTTVSDGILDIDFSSEASVGGVDQPKISAIEIIGGSSQFPPIQIDPIANQLHMEGELVNGVAVSASGGDPNANFTYGISGQPAGIDVEPTNGQIFGTVAVGAGTGGPNSDGIYNVTVTVTKPGSTPANTGFTWTINSTGIGWVDKNESENYIPRHECGFIQAGNKFYLMGGRESAAVEIYDYATDNWTQLPDAPEVFHHFQPVEYAGLIWVIGGLKGPSFPIDDPVEFVWAFDAGANEWIQGPPIPASRRRGAGGLVIYNGKFYMVSGSTNGHSAGYVPWFDEYDPATGTWTQLADAPRGRDHFYAAVIGDQLYSLGGRETGGAQGFFAGTIPEVDVYDFNTQTWSTLPASANMPTPRGGSPVAVFNNKLMVMGGAVENQDVYGVMTTGTLNITEEFDPITQTWQRLGDAVHPRRATQAIVSGNGIFMASGSPQNSGGQQKNMEYYQEDNPVGTALVSSNMTGPSMLQFTSSSVESVTLDVTGGNVGILVKSIDITGPDASDFSVQTGDLDFGLLMPNTQHNLGVLYSGTGNNASATLTVNYGASSQLNISLSGPVNNNLSWLDKNENENYTARHECSFVQAGNKFYLMGGRNDENPQDIDIYDYNTNTWTTLVNSSPLELNHFQAVEYQGLIWVIGAFMDNSFPNEAPAENIWAFDPVTQNWIQGPQIPVNRRRGSTGLVVYNDKFYVVGGNTIGHNGGYVAWFDEYDPMTGTWTSLTDAPRARDHFAATLISNKLYLAGGRLSGGAGGVFAPTISEVDVYDFATGNWSTLPSAQNIPTPRAAASSVNFNDRLVVIGGEVENQLVYGTLTSDALKITEEYDPVSQSWRRLADMNYDRHGTQAIVSGGGIFTLAGSPNLGGGNQKNMEVLGLDAPVGTPSAASTLSGPATADVDSSTGADIGISLSNGNVGLFVSSMSITGPNAANFFISSGELTNGLLKANATHTVSISYTGNTEGETASLTVNYGTSSQYIVALNSTVSAPSAVESLTLVNADTNTDIFNLTEGQQIDQAQIQGILLNIRANTNPATVGSVFLSITGTLNNSRTENVAPYALYGDAGGNYAGVPFPLGNYTASATAYSGSGQSGTVLGTTTIQFSVVDLGGGNQPPTAIASADTNMGDAPLTVNFTGINSTDDVGVTGYLWDFKDGTPNSTVANPNHVFTNPGTYDVDLTVTDGGGLTDMTTLTITVNDPNINLPPTAVASADISVGDAPLSVNFTGSNSTDDVGVTGYLWDFKDGSPTTTVANPSHTFTNPGTYDVELTVTDGGGLSDMTTLTITANDPALNGVQNFTLINADNDTDILIITEGQQIDQSVIQGISLNIRANTNPATVGSVFLSLTGTLINSRTENVAPYALYGDAGGNYAGVTFPLGDYTMSATAYSGPGLSGSVLGTLTVQFSVVDPGGGNQPPTAIASADTNMGNTPLTVNFTGSNSTDDVGVTGYLWDFKDGSPTTTVDNPTHIFTNPGSFDVELTVMDEGGLTDMTTITITATDGSNLPPNVTNPGTQTDNEGDAISLQIIATDESSNLDYSAVNLPPNLTINPTSGLISGTISAGSGSNAFQESNGLVIMEAESVSLVPAWTITNAGGSTGIIAGTNSFNVQNGGTMSYQIAISNPGVYRFNWRSFFSGPEPTEENDSWLRFPNDSNVWFFGFQGNPVSEANLISNLQGAQNNVVFPVGSGREGPGTIPNGSTSNGFFKIVRSGGASEVYDWQALTSDNDGHDIYVWFVNPGEYTMEISERSAGHAIERVALYRVDGPSYTDNQLTTLPESPSSQGAASNSPYTVDITVTDDSFPPLSTTEQFIWNIGQGNQSPVAIASADVISGDAPLDVSFTGSNSTDDIGIVTYLWDFDDGSTSNLEDPIHTFTNPGTYDVVLTVTDGGGLMDSAQITIDVLDPALNALVSFTLVNGDTDADMFNLLDSQQIDESVVQGIGLNIRANTNPSVVGSVSLSLSGPLNSNRTENVAPYALFGDNAGDYGGVNFPVGNYTLSGTAYSGAGLSGTVLGTRTIQFSIVTSGSKGYPINTQEVTEVAAEPKTKGISTYELYPNPSSYEVHLMSTNPIIIPDKIGVYDMSGRLVKLIDAKSSRTGPGHYSLTISELESGVYQILLMDQSSNPFSRHRLVINR